MQKQEVPKSPPFSYQLDKVLFSGLMRMQSGKPVLVQVGEHWGGNICWVAYVPDQFGLWQHIPCFTRSEEKRFPTSVARFADGLLNYYKASRQGKQESLSGTQMSLSA